MKMKKLYLDSETADVLFVFSDGTDDERELVPAHKSLLAVGSKVFHAMFYGSLKESGDITIVDASAAAFKEFLQFFYLARVNLTMENISDVMNLGEKYDVPVCQLLCEKFLKDMLSDGNVCIAYNLALLFDFHELRKLCEAKISANTEIIFQSSAFLECSPLVLRHILALNILTCTETELFHACVAWLRAATKQEEVTRELCHHYLGDLFYDIRFGSMTIEEFAALSPEYGHLFSFDEYQDIIQLIVSKDFQSKYFKNPPRQVQWNSDTVIECNRTINDPGDNGTIYIRYSETTTFSTNALLVLGELVFAPLYLRKELPTEIAICEISNKGISKIICIENTNLHTVYIGNYVLSLTKPLLIRPGFKYKIHFDRGFTNSKGRKLKSEVHMDSDIIIQFTGSAGPIAVLKFNPIPFESTYHEHMMQQ